MSPFHTLLYTYTSYVRIYIYLYIHIYIYIYIIVYIYIYNIVILYICMNMIEHVYIIYIYMYIKCIQILGQSLKMRHWPSHGQLSSKKIIKDSDLRNESWNYVELVPTQNDRNEGFSSFQGQYINITRGSTFLHQGMECKFLRPPMELRILHHSQRRLPASPWRHSPRACYLLTMQVDRHHLSFKHDGINMDQSCLFRSLDSVLGYGCHCPKHIPSWSRRLTSPKRRHLQTVTSFSGR